MAPADVQLVALKRAEDGHGWIARLWNPGDREVAACIALRRGTLKAARLTNLAEGDTGDPLAVRPDGVTVPLPARAVATLRLSPEP